MTETVNLTWAQLTSRVMTNLFLYGTLTTPEDYDDRIRPTNVDAPEINLDMGSFMADGPGKYALACNATFVQWFFAPTLEHGLENLSGSYTVQELIDLGFSEELFKIRFQHYAVDRGSADWAQRTYILNTCAFILARDTRFVFEAGSFRIENLHIRAFQDNFDFDSGSWEAQLGNLYLRPEIDPYSLGKPVIINFVGGGEPVQSVYDISDFNADVAKWNSLYNPIVNLPLVMPAMAGIVNDLKASGTIEYSKDGRAIVYGSGGADTLSYVAFTDPLIIVGGQGADQIDGAAGISDWILGGDGDDTMSGHGGGDFFDGGAGQDVVVMDGFTGVTSTFHLTQADSDAIPDDPGISDSEGLVFQLMSGEEVDTLRDVETIRFGAGTQTIVIDGSVQPGPALPAIDGGDGDDTADFSPFETSVTVGTPEGFNLVNFERFIGSDFDDTFHLLSGVKKVDGGAGTDVVDFSGAPSAVIVGTPSGVVLENVEQVVGSQFRDTFFGLAGMLTIDGGAGNDLLIGRDGAVLKGGAGADYLLADGGAVTLDGGAGNDYLEATGDGPVTYVFGRGAGHDVIGSLWPSPSFFETWNADDDWFFDRMNDKVILQDLSPNDISFVWDYDTFQVDDYNDGSIFVYSYWLYGGLSIVINDTGDSLYLGEITVFTFHSYHPEWYPEWIGPELRSGELGYDYHYWSFNANYIPQHDSPFQFLVFSDGVARGLEELFDYFLPPITFPSTDIPPEHTSALDEHLAGQSGQGALSGGDSSGSDLVTGTEGTDRLYGGHGADTLIGGGGNDIVLAGTGNDLIVAGAGDDYCNGGNGRDTLSFADMTIGVTVDLEAGTASKGGLGSDALSSIENVIGGAGDDLIRGTDESDALAGDGGNELIGGGGNDTLDGGSGIDTLIGGTGDDTYVVDSAYDETVEDTNAGTDTVIAMVDHALGANLENLELRGGASGTGNALANVILGNAGANILRGLDGDDTLTGGYGADRFEFFGGETGRDTITDFTRGEDRIVLTDFRLDMLQAGVNFMVDAGPSVARATLLYDNHTGVLSYDSDGTGAAEAIQIAILSKRPALRASDFVVLETM